MEEQKQNGSGFTWHDLLGMIWQEVRWFLQTLGIVALTIGVGRIVKWLTRGGIDLEAILKGGWHEQIDASLKGSDKEKNSE